MSKAPTIPLNLAEFKSDPFLQLSRMRKETPIAFIPELNWYMMTKYEDIFESEKLAHIFSSEAPRSRMEKTIGRSMLLKNGAAHSKERATINPTLRYKAMKDYWNEKFIKIVDNALDSFVDQKSGDLFSLLSMSVAADALKEITGFRELSREEIIDLSSELIGGITNMQNNPAVADISKAASEKINNYIAKAKLKTPDPLDRSVLSYAIKGGFSDEQLQSNLKLIISGGLNEPRSGLAGTVAALLTHPEELSKCQSGEVEWMKAFEEFGRWQLL